MNSEDLYQAFCVKYGQPIGGLEHAAIDSVARSIRDPMPDAADLAAGVIVEMRYDGVVAALTDYVRMAFKLGLGVDDQDLLWLRPWIADRVLTINRAAQALMEDEARERATEEDGP